MVAAVAVCLAACASAPGGLPKSGRNTGKVVFARWVQRYGQTLTRIVQDSLIFEESPSVDACAALHRAVSGAREVPAPPTEGRQWKTALRDLARGASKCEKGVPTAGNTFGHGGSALREIVHAMAKSHVGLGMALEGESEAVLRGIAATAAPPPTTTPSSRTAE